MQGMKIGATLPDGSRCLMVDPMVFGHYENGVATIENKYGFKLVLGDEQLLSVMVQARQQFMVSVYTVEHGILTMPSGIFINLDEFYNVSGNCA